MTIIGLVFVGMGGLFGLEALTGKRFPLAVFGWASLAAGIVINGWCMLGMQMVWGGWSRWLWVVELLVAGLVMVWCRRRIQFWWQEFKQSRQQWGWMDGVMLVTLVIISGVLVVGQLRHEYIHSDGLTLWFMRGKVFYRDGGIVPASQLLPVFTSVNEAGNRYAIQSMARYPVLIPLTIAATYASVGKEAVVAAKSIWIGLYLSGLLLLWMVGRERWGGRSVKSGLGVFLVALLPVMWRHFTAHWFGGADLWLGIYYLMGVACLYWWDKKKSNSYLWLAVFMLGGATMIKVEGLVGVVAMGIIVWWGRRRLSWLKVAGLGCLLVAPSLWWYRFSAQFGLQADYLGQVLTGLGESSWLAGRARLALGEMIRALVRWQDYLVFYGITAIVPVMVWRQKGRRRWLGLYILPVAGWLFILFSYVVNNLELQSLLYASLPRLYSQWIPALAFLTVVGIGEVTA